MRISDWSSDVCSSDLHSEIDRGVDVQGFAAFVDQHVELRQRPVGEIARAVLPAFLRELDIGGLGGVGLRLGDDVRVDHDVEPDAGARSEERRVGKEWVQTCRSRGPPLHSTAKNADQIETNENYT